MTKLETEGILTSKEAEELLETVVKDKALINKHRGNFIRQYEARNSNAGWLRPGASPSAVAPAPGTGTGIGAGADADAPAGGRRASMGGPKTALIGSAAAPSAGEDHRSGGS